VSTPLGAKPSTDGAMRGILNSLFVAIIDVVVYRLTTFVIINPDSENRIDKRVAENVLRP
jgi:hypothetical protein